MSIKIPGYNILAVSGSGSDGRVYRAAHLTRKHPVALKVFNEKISSNVRIRDRFFKEVRRLAQLNHENIARVYEHTESSGMLVLVSEFAQGRSLEWLFEQQKIRLSGKKAKFLSHQILEAVLYAHQKKVIHGELKPSNIFVTKKGLVKITDFGILKITGRKKPGWNENRIGNLFYLSPERLSGKKVGFKGDIYSVGAVLFSIFTGKSPFEEKVSSLEDVLNLVNNRRMPNPMEISTGISSATADAIMLATAIEPAERLDNIEEFMDILSGKKNLIAEISSRSETGEEQKKSSRPSGKKTKPGKIPEQKSSAADRKKRKDAELFRIRIDEIIEQGITCLNKGDSKEALKKAQKAFQLSPLFPQLGNLLSRLESADSPLFVKESVKTADSIYTEEVERKKPVHKRKRKSRDTVTPRLLRKPAEAKEKSLFKAVLIGVISGFAAIALIIVVLLSVKQDKPAEPVIESPDPYSVRLALSGPDDVVFRIDGEQIQPDSSGIYSLSGTDFGNRVAEIQAEGYEILERQLELIPGYELVDSLILEQLGSNNVRVSFQIIVPEGELQPDEAHVSCFINGELADSLPVTLVTGRYIFHAEFEGYQAVPETILVNRPGSLNQQLLLKPPDTAEIRLYLQSDISGTADFYVDGSRVSSGSRSMTHIASEGEHTLFVRMSGMQDWSSVIELESEGFTQTVILQEALESGRLLISPEPWSEVFIDGRSIGETPLPPIDLSPGDHMVRLSNPEFEDQIQTVTIISGEDYTIRFSSEEISGAIETGRLLIGPEPWAEVYINGASIGQTPMPPVELEPGNYSIRLTNPDFEDQAHQVTIEAGEDVSIRYSASEIVEEEPVIPPVAISKTDPVYPEEFLQQNDLSGMVTLYVRVGADGLVKSVNVANDGLGYGCGIAALEAVEQWVFSPATQGGIPVEATTTVSVRFQIE